MKTSELIGSPLDWAVAKCEMAEGWLTEDTDDHSAPLLRRGYVFCSYSTGVTPLGKEAGAPEYKRGFSSGKWNPSTDWSQGGPIIEREKLCVGYKHQCDPDYCPINDPATNCWARTTGGGYISYGPTPLIAIMRCYVRSKMGDDVELPEELK